MYDVIIIGAGPTGSSAAIELAKRGYRILMVEKFKIPRNKSCSGILIQKSIQLVRTYFGEDVPQTVMCTPADSKGMIFTNDDGREYRYEQDGSNIWRHSFDAWLAQKAAANGVELRDETSAVFCEEQDDCVSVRLKGASSKYTEKAKLVIACDGVVSTIKRKITHSPRNYITTFQTFNEGFIDLDPHYFYAYLQPDYSEYDAWFNVKDDLLIFGVSVKNTSKIGHFYKRFIDYMEQEHHAKIEKQVRTEKWLMPHIMPGCPIDYGEGRVLFAGEAAGFLNPMGEGISAGLESGNMAAKAIHESGYNIQEAHALYKTNTKALKTYMERQWRFVAGMSTKFLHMSE